MNTLDDAYWEEVWTDLELQAEEARLSGNPPINAGTICPDCGLAVEVPWDYRLELRSRVEAHECPA